VDAASALRADGALFCGSACVAAHRRRRRADAAERRRCGGESGAA
jgi:hypothetical protein